MELHAVTRTMGLRTLFQPAIPYRTGMYLFVALLANAAFALAFIRFGKGLWSGTLNREAFVYFHAFVVVAWSLLFVWQVTLVRMRNISTHKAVGLYGVWLTAFLVGDGVYTSIRAAQLGGEHVFAPPPIFLAFLLVLSFEVAVLAGTGLAMRNRTDIHKRLMLAAFITMLPVALVRLPLGLFGGPLGALAITDGTLLTAAIYDAVRRRRPHPALFLALAFLIIMQAITFALVASPEWARLVDRLVPGP